MGLSLNLNVSIASAYTIDVGNGPVDPFVISDFKNAAFSIDGVTKTMADLWHEDTRWSTFDPANLEAGVGLHNLSAPNYSAPTATTALNAALFPNGFTAVVDFPSATSLDFQAVNLDTFTGYWEYDANFSGFDLYTPNNYNGGPPFFTAQNQPHRVAFTMSPTVMAASTDGGAVTSVSDNVPMTNSLSFVIGGVNTVAYIAFYPPQNDASLQTLSAA